MQYVTIPKGHVIQCPCCQTLQVLPRDTDAVWDNESQQFWTLHMVLGCGHFMSCPVIPIEIQIQEPNNTNALP